MGDVIGNESENDCKKMGVGIFLIFSIIKCFVNI